MSEDSTGWAQRLRDMLLVIIAAMVLFTALYYFYILAFQSPYPGFDADGNWRIISFDATCDPRTPNCAAQSGPLLLGDRLLKIGNLTYEQYQIDRSAVPFAGYLPGDRVPVTFERGGAVMQTYWGMPQPQLSARLGRLSGLFLFAPFWLTGTAVLILLRPRDIRWLLMIIFSYLTGLWLVSGTFSTYRVAASIVVLRALTLFLLPVYLHLHIMLPEPLRPVRRWTMVLAGLYLLAAVLTIVELFRPLPTVLFPVCTLLAVISSLAVILYRSFSRTPSSTRLATRLMLVGIGLGFGPGILLWIVPQLLGLNAPGAVVTALTTLSIPLQPCFYIYALYKRRLGNLEFRANRLLSLYGFLLLFGTGYVVVFVLGSQWIKPTPAELAFGLILSVLAVIVATWLRSPFQHWIDRMAYGTAHDPETLVRTFANEIPRALDRDALAGLLTRQVLPALLIRQSALYLFGPGEITPVYTDEVPGDAARRLPAHLDRLLAAGGHYLPPETQPRPRDPFDWVRLVVPIELGDKPIAAWLFGRRDPDDYYPAPDIDLLRTLGNQVGVALENARLFENLQRRATELETAYEDLRKLDQLKDEFVQNVSHELRTPLTFIRGYTELMLEEILGPLNNQQREALETVTDRAEGVIRLVNDIISLQQAQLEQFKMEPVNVVVLVRACLEAAEMTAKKGDAAGVAHRFVLEVADNVPLVLGDRRRLAQVLDNLLNNATKFSPEGGEIAVRIRTANHEFAYGKGSQPGVEISVADQGIGIPKAEIDRIWQRFYQVDGSSTRRFGGMGLGLAIVRGIVEAHKGAITVESQPGAGTTFHVLLPATTTEDGPSGREDAGREPAFGA